jgi:hypothetical protein
VEKLCASLPKDSKEKIRLSEFSLFEILPGAAAAG